MIRAIISDAEAMTTVANAAGTREDPIDVDALAHNNPTSCPQLQDEFMDPTSLAFNANQGITSEKTVLTTVAPTAIEQLQVTTNLSVPNESVGYAEKRDTLLPTALLMMTEMTIISSRIRDMLETELVTQGNKGGSITVFLSFLPSPYGLTISPSTYGHNITCSPM